ncbi:hypothetical protein [Streptomyces sp. I05A-00742]|uniref:hypothetical protein n=1 Tax=Streptomyces sp. I05A-00742 TaxID=2732853 RepID=UPI00201770E5|nr:hypothetical protein [Streptomyces sp. I05A-00742]
MERASGVPGVSQQRAANLRMVALAAAVALAVVLPLAAATAGPVSPAGRPDAGPETEQEAARGRAGAAPARSGGGDALGVAAAAAGDLVGGASDGSGDGAGRGAAFGMPPAGPGEPRDAAQCGPELDSPDGLEAQTCVLTEGGETWARTYYRNGTDDPLTGVLTLMAPDGRSLQVRCPMPASGAPDACETPRRRTLRGHGAYTAVAEIASAEGKLLLRSGSNSPGVEED